MTNTTEQQTSRKKQRLPKLSGARETWSQDNDCCDSDDSGQFLEIENQDGGGGNYIVIKTTRWAIDANEIDAFAKMLKKFLKRIENSSTLK
jgi:hypothetical protein